MPTPECIRSSGAYGVGVLVYRTGDAITVSGWPPVNADDDAPPLVPWAVTFDIRDATMASRVNPDGTKTLTISDMFAITTDAATVEFLTQLKPL